jgi:murein L,D-transpeptidase YcbB/YkuD
MKTILKYFFSVFLLLPVASPGQITPNLLKQQLDSKIAGIKYPEQVKNFYGLLGYQPQWIQQSNASSKLILLGLLSSAEQYGLNEKDYQYDLIQSLRNNSITLNDANDSAGTDILLSDAAIHFFTELSFGNTIPAIGYNGLDYKPGFFNVSEKLAKNILQHRLPAAVSEFEPASAEYRTIRNKLVQFLQIRNTQDFKEVFVTSNKVTVSNLPLRVKFYQLGFLDSANAKTTDLQLKDVIKKVQKLFNIKQDGILTKDFLNDLNVLISARVTELRITLNTFRWLQNVKQSQPVIVVNIPSATLLVYENNKLIVESKIIVGKPSTPTPTLTSRVTEVILYPYWTVPNKIAVKELLPSIKHNTGFLENNNYQVLNRQGKVINPYKINWNSLSSSNFPYIIRQSTGCDNALGIVKLNFNNPFGVYLHDTPGKTLFSYSKRYFSHGCMRVEKAVELAHLILRENTIAIDTLEEKGCLLHQSPVIVPANNPLAVFVLYNTAWVDSDMNVNFSEDVYKKFPSLLKYK